MSSLTVTQLFEIAGGLCQRLRKIPDETNPWLNDVFGWLVMSDQSSFEYGLTKYKLHWAWQRAALSLAVTVPRLECHIIAAVKYARKKRQKQQCHLQCQRKEVVELSWNGRSQRRTPSSKLCEKLCWILKVCNYFLFQTFFSFHYSSLGTLNPLTTCK